MFLNSLRYFTSKKFFFENIHELKCSGNGLIYVRFIKFFPILELVES